MFMLIKESWVQKRLIVCLFYMPSSTNRFFVVNSDAPEISNNAIREFQDAVFFENIFP